MTGGLLKMVLMVGRNRNTNDEATMGSISSITNTTTVTVVPANANRIFFCINNDDAVTSMWVKLQAASVDNDLTGIFVPKGAAWAMPVDNVYTGEISVIANGAAGVDVHYVEY